MFCDNCGVKNNDDAKFCRSCGASLLQAAALNQPVAQTPAVPVPQTEIPVFQPKMKEGVGFGGRGTGENLVLKCSLCGSQDFARDTARMDSKWGFTSFKVIILTCQKCGHIELFNKGRSIFDFD